MLFGQMLMAIHVRLSQEKITSVGVSFPEKTSLCLGRTLRLHGSILDLEIIAISEKLSSLRDKVTIKPVAAIPATTQFYCVRRVQSKSSPDRERRRLMRRKGLTQEQANVMIPDSARKTLDLPYVWIKSHSSGQKFRLFIEEMTPSSRAIPGVFGAYGLSATTTVPLF